MKMEREFTIDGLVEDLAPVRRLNPMHGFALILGATALAIIAIAAVFGLRSDVVHGNPHPMVMLRGGCLLLLGLASSVAVISAARPAVGRVSEGWRWALAMAALFPVSAAILAITNGPVPIAALESQIGMYCLETSIGSALLIGAALTLWLRQGAPTLLNRAGWLAGLAAGSFGTFAFSLHCPVTGIYYIGLWYSLAVAVCAALGRLIVPRFIRW